MITIPKQHYVGFSDRGGEIPLGFATPYDETSAFQKRKNTVDRWSDKKTDPKIVDNQLLNDFEISRSVRRSGWGHGNVVWRIIDPRGFELEISSANFARIVDCTTIINGVIQQKCVWGRDGANNVLLPENSEPYLKATENTVRASTSVSATDLTPGDIVIHTNGDRMQYCGLYHIVAVTETRGKQYYSYDQTTTYKASVKKRYAFINLSRDKYDPYELVSNVNVSSIEQKTAQPIDTKDVAVQLTNAFVNYACGVYGATFANDKPIKQTDLTFVSQPVTFDAMMLMLDSYRYGYRHLIAFTYNNVVYHANSKHEDSYRNNMVRLVGHKVTGDLTQDQVVVSQNRKRYGTDNRADIFIDGDCALMYVSGIDKTIFTEINRWVVCYQGQTYPLIC